MQPKCNPECSRQTSWCRQAVAALQIDNFLQQISALQATDKSKQYTASAALPSMTTTGITLSCP